MKKLANPFDSFTAEHTPDDFAVCSWQAAKWLLPFASLVKPRTVVKPKNILM